MHLSHISDSGYVFIEWNQFPEFAQYTNWLINHTTGFIQVTEPKTTYTILSHPILSPNVLGEPNQ